MKKTNSWQKEIIKAITDQKPWGYSEERKQLWLKIEKEVIQLLDSIKLEERPEYFIGTSDEIYGNSHFNQAVRELNQKIEEAKQSN